MLVLDFKSIPQFWRKENLNLKRNTVRSEPLDEDPRFDILWKCTQGKITDLIVRIKNSETGEQFKRKVTDVSYYKGTYIISW